jgi:hypothetical protein
MYKPGLMREHRSRDQASLLQKLASANRHARVLDEKKCRKIKLTATHDIKKAASTRNQIRVPAASYKQLLNADALTTPTRRRFPSSQPLM